MSPNELLLVLMVLFSTGLVIAAWTLSKERIYSITFLFLILITIGGGKIVEFFGFQTNTGNIFYGAIFLATYFLIERHGKREGIRSIGIGVAGVIFFTLLLQMVVALSGSDSTSGLDLALSQAFEPATRLALASICGYVLSQTFNVYFYVFLKERYGLRHLWLRANASNVLAQIIDSAVFFTVAFWGVVAPGNIGEIMIVGFVMKVLYVALTSPLLYMNKIEGEDGKTYASITTR